MEIERKWLVDKSKISAFTNFGYRIEQHYLSDIEDEWLIRVRNMMGKYTLTLKSTGLMEREEIETTISEDVYNNAVKCSKRSLKKTRFRVDFDFKKKLTYEIDVFDDYDFIICEIEFQTMDDALNYEPPNWCLEEITFNNEYTNYSLAK